MINNYPLFMVFWNIFLALIPCGVVYFLAKNVGKKSWKKLTNTHQLFITLAFLIWFFFLPNTTYLFTMVRHLLNHCTDYHPLFRTCQEEAWMEIFFFTYAAAGLPTFLYALQKMTTILTQLFGKLFRFFPLLMIPLTALGTLFGLLERFDSWEVITKPFIILQAGWSYIAEPWKLKNLLIYTLFLYLIYYGSLYLLKKLSTSYGKTVVSQGR